MQIFKTMKSFLIKIAIFFFILVVIDRLVGYTFSYLSQHSDGEYAGRPNYIANSVQDDILIMGSSRAAHHYNPKVLSDSLGLSCYNCGMDGQGIVLFYGWWQMIKERYCPKIVVYDFSNGFDLLAGENNHKFLGNLKSYYERSNIRDIFEAVDKNEKYKMLSQMYRYNSKPHKILQDYLKPSKVKASNGFKPLKGMLDTMRIKKDDRKSLEINKPICDSLKIEFLEKLIEETNGLKLIFAVSPIWYGMEENELSVIRELCKKHHIPFLDFSNDSKYVHNNEYFKDGTHLNARGADEFSRDFVRKLKPYL